MHFNASLTVRSKVTKTVSINHILFKREESTGGIALRSFCLPT